MWIWGPHLNRNLLIACHTLLECKHWAQFLAGFVRTTVIHLIYVITHLLNFLSPLFLDLPISDALTPFLRKIVAYWARTTLWKANISDSKAEIWVTWRSVRGRSPTQASWIIPSKARSQYRSQRQLLLILTTFVALSSNSTLTSGQSSTLRRIHCHFLQILISIVSCWWR